MGQGLGTCYKRSPKNSDIKSNTYNSFQINSDDFQGNYNNTERYKIIIELNTLDKKYNYIKLKNKIFYDDIGEKEEYISNYREFLTELNHQINNIKDNLNIYVINQIYFDNYFSKDEENELINDIKIYQIKLIK